MYLYVFKEIGLSKISGPDYRKIKAIYEYDFFKKLIRSLAHNLGLLNNSYIGWLLNIVTFQEVRINFNHLIK